MFERLTLDALRPYQDRGIDELYDNDEKLLRVKMGGGKTVMLATAAQELIADGVVKRFLILAPKRVAQVVWPTEFERWGHLDPSQLGVAIGTPEHRMDMIESDLPFVALNYENLDWLIDVYGNEHGFDAVIFDEITRLKNSKGKRFKKIARRLKDFKVRWGGTGTLTSQGVVDLYGQAFVIDRGKALGKTFAQFRREHFIYVGPNPWDWAPMSDAEQKASAKIAPFTFQIDGTEYEDQLPELVDDPVVVPLPAHAAEKYAEMNKEFITMTSRGLVDAANAGVMTGKLRQIANGFLYTTPDELDYDWLHDAKLDGLEEILHNMGGEPLLVAYQFRAELEKLQERWPAPYLGSGVADRAALKAIEDWNAGRLPILYLHPQSAGHGLNLQKGGNSIAWYGLPWSLDDYDQTIARLRRSGQDSDTVWNYPIIAEGTIDEAVLDALRYKRRVQEAVYDYLRKAA